MGEADLARADEDVRAGRLAPSINEREDMTLCETSEEAMNLKTVTFACIDAGGTRTRMLASRDDVVIFRGHGGPANPNAVDEATLRESFASAARECPEIDRLLAAVAGAGSPAIQGRIRRLLESFFPGAEIDVVPDYAGAFWSSPLDTDVCVIAGTGSAVVSPGTPPEQWALSGGRGWILGDHGSASYLGRHVLSTFAERPDLLPVNTRDELLRAYRAERWQQIARHLQQSSKPARDLAIAAPILTRIADEGHAPAAALVRMCMTPLAATTARHIGEHVGGADVTIALRGGVWTSPSARIAFLDSLRAQTDREITVSDDLDDPVERLIARMRTSGSRVP